MYPAQETIVSQADRVSEGSDFEWYEERPRPEVVSVKSGSVWDFKTCIWGLNSMVLKYRNGAC